VSASGSLGRIAHHLVEAVRPLEDAFSDADAFRVLLLQLGWDAPGLPPSYRVVTDKVVQATSALEALADGATVDEVLSVVDKAGAVYRAIDALTEAPEGIDAGAFLPELARRLFEYLLGRQLLAEAPDWYATLEALGIIVPEDHPPTADRPGFVRIRFDWDQIPAILSDPALIPARMYGWGTPDLNFPKIAELLTEVAIGLGLPASLDELSEELAAALQAEATGPPEKTATVGMTVVLFDVPLPGGATEPVGLRIAELPAEGGALPGMVILPKVPDGIAERLDLGDGWVFALRVGTDLAAQLGVVARPGGISLRYPGVPGQALPSAGFGASLVYEAQAPRLLFGQPGRTRLELSAASLGMEVDVRAGDLELKAAAEGKGLTLVISPEDADAFLGSVLGSQEARLDLAFGIAWSSRTGLSVLAGAGFAVTLYPHRDFGLVRFDRVDLAVNLAAGGTPALKARASAAFSGDLGPITFSVDRLGAELAFTFTDGNAGPFDVRLEPLWPTGLGLVIEAGPVTGGGFVSLDQDRGRYIGVLQLDVFDIGVTAIGILDTRDAAGRDLPAPGFSFLVLIAVELPPIQLGFGFTLRGVGGLAAINRRLDTPALLAGVRTGALDSILFPDDPIRDAPVIVSALGAIFPTAMGRYVFGPMAIIGWGTPTLIHIELAVVLEVPDPVMLALIGRASVAIPEDVAILDLKVDVVGVLDFGRSLLAVDASLRDSRVASFPIAGDMAMRLSFGAEPNFALAVGGLNPQFAPPAGFPTLRRISVALGDGDNPRIGIEGYLAVTSNSLQFGARAELYAAAGGFNVRGWLSFDALFVFQPFSFRFDFSVGVSLNRGSTRIAGVTVRGTLTGPSPFHAWGKATLSLLFFDISVPFDATFGERRAPAELPPADPWPLLAAAIALAENWSAELPARTAVAATLRPSEGAPDLMLHPMGVAVLRQKVVPLGRVLERFGQFEIGGPDRFDVAEVRVGGQPGSAWSMVTDHFAPGDFEDLSDTEKLSRDSFEPMDAGVRVGADTVGAPLAAMKTAAVEYETKIIDAPWRTRLGDRFRPSRGLQLVQSRTSAKAGSPLGAAGRGRFARDVTRAGAVMLDPERYTVASTDTLGPFAGGASGLTRGAAHLALKHMAASAARLQVVPDHELEPIG
jgi:hypothetical protein